MCCIADVRYLPLSECVHADGAETIKLLDHVKALTDRLLVLETEKAALVVSNASLSRDLLETKRTLVACTCQSLAAATSRCLVHSSHIRQPCLARLMFPVPLINVVAVGLNGSPSDDLSTLLQTVGSVVAENSKSEVVYVLKVLYLRFCTWARGGELRFFATVTTACAKQTGAAASVERGQREPNKAVSPAPVL